MVDQRAVSFTLGILEAGRVPDALAARFETYVDMFARMVKTSAPDHWAYRTYAVLDDELPSSVTDCDAWLITGSRFGAYEDYPWIHALKGFLRSAYGAGVPMVGICFGHQILAQALGGRVEKSGKGWGIGTHHYQWVDDKPAWVKATELNESDDFAIQAFHQDQVAMVPPDATIIAQSEFCEVAALAYGQQVISFQGHPEFKSDFVSHLIEDRRGPILGDAVADKAVATLDQPIDDVAIGEAIVEFLKARQREKMASVN